MSDEEKIIPKFGGHMESCICKGTVSRDFRLLVFFMKPLSIPLGLFRIFSKIRLDIRSSRCTDTGGKWKKSSIIKVLNTLFGHLWEVDLTYRYIFAFTLRSQQPDIVPTTGVNNTGGNNTSETGGKICRRCR
jgi:hypothetical protein